jgi:radical SAM superfamily enzyme YgiQ (UPF0313 family)
MAATGCDSISFGVESGSPEMLKRVRKGIKLSQVTEAIRMCKQSGMLAHASFMVGLPGETKETLHQTGAFAESLKILFGYHYLSPFPGTTLCEKIDQYDLEILTRDWSKYDANDAIVQTSALTPQNIRDFVAVYDTEMNGHWQKVIDNYKTGRNSTYDDMRVEGQYRMNITFAILKEDLVEKLGFIEAALLNGDDDSAVKIFSARMKKAITGDPRLIENTVTDFISRGYIKSDESNQGCTWRWA